MRCIKCNYDNLDGLKYCVSCGSPLITEEDKEKMEAASAKKMKTLYIIVGILVILLVVLVVLLVMGVGFGKGSTPVATGDIDTATLGTWVCNSNPNSTDYTIVIELNEDGSFRFGAYGALETNHISGTYTSKGNGQTNNGYTQYNVVLNQTRIVSGSKVQEGQATSNYLAGISQDGKQSTFYNENTQLSYYCKK